MSQILYMALLPQFYLSTIYISEALKLKGTKSAAILQNDWKIISSVKGYATGGLYSGNSEIKGKTHMTKTRRDSCDTP